jgi:hypothetical protein
MRNYDLELLTELIDRRNFKVLRSELEDMNEVDIALFIEELPKEKMTVAFRTLPKDMAADVFSNLEPDTQQIIIGSITDKELSIIVEDLFVDDAVDMLEELPANVVKRVLKNATPATPAGKVFAYHGTTFAFTVGRPLEIADGRPLREIITREIFEKCGIEKRDVFDPSQGVFTAIFRYEQLTHEYETLCKTLEKGKIPFMPLKGSVIRKYYPDARGK